MPFYIGLFLAFAIAVFSLNTIMRLYGTKNELKRLWNELDEIWKRRYSEVIRLVDFAKPLVSDRKIFHYILHAKNECHMAKTQIELAQANHELGVEYNKLLAYIIENCILEEQPDEVCSEFDSIHKNIISLEEKLAFTRSFFDEYTLRYNNLVTSFPTKAIANLCNFRKKVPMPRNEESNK